MRNYCFTHKWVRRTFFGIGLLFFLAFPAVALDSQNGDPIDPGVSAAEVTEAMQAQLDALKAETEGEEIQYTDSVLDRNSLSYLLENRWLMTRMVLHGINLDGFQQAIQEVQKQTEISKEIDAYSMNQLTSAGVRGINVADELASYNATDRYTETVVEIHESLSDIPGVALGNTIFDRTRALGYLILMIGIMARLVFTAYKILTHQDVRSFETISTLVKSMILLLVIAYLRPIIVAGLDLSDAAAAAISGGDPSAIMKSAQDLLRVRSDIAAIGDGKVGILSLPSVRDIIGFVAYKIAAAVIYVLLILADVMMAITAAIGPIVMGISTVPAFERYISQWIRSFITFLFYGPLAVVYCILLVGIMAMGIDSSFLTFLVICIAYIIGATKVPSMAESMSGVALAGMAMGMAAIPATATKLGMVASGRLAARGVASKVGLSKLIGGGGGGDAPSA